MIHWIELRDAPYMPVLEAQRRIFGAMTESRRSGRPVGDETVFIVEHRPVYTLGRHGCRDNLVDEAFIRENGIDLVRIERGGDITFHGPGQVVVYPIIDLRFRHLGVKSYVRLLEQAVIMTLDDFGIAGERVDGATGVWIGAGTDNERKICAIGIKCSRFVTMHGLALNVSTDLRYFRVINPCGFTDRGVTSVSAELGRRIAFDDAAAVLKSHLSALLDSARVESHD